MSKKQAETKQSVARRNKPRHVRMPPHLDQWLQEEAARSTVGQTVADKIREIVGAAYEQRDTQEQAA